MNRSVEAFLDTNFIPRQNEPSPIVVGSKLWEESSFEYRKRHFSGERLFYRKMNQ